MKVFTVATPSSNQGYYPQLLESCKKFKIDINLLATNETWKNFSWKLNLIKDEIKKIPDNEIVLFIDAYDIVFLSNLEEIKEKYLYLHNKGVKILFGANRYDLKIERILANINFRSKNLNQKYNLNSGTYIGYNRYLKHLFSILDVGDDEDDELHLNLIYQRHPELLQLDKENLIFGLEQRVIWQTNYLKLKENRLIHKEFHTMPCLIHGPGEANITYLLTQLGYKNCKSRPRTIASMWSRMKTFLKTRMLTPSNY